MPVLTINGQTCSTTKNKKLIDFLRDDLNLTSVKSGCQEGACGSCTILVDGRPIRSCTYTTTQSEGKLIITCEGLSEREKDVYAFAFAEAGAVQCGFCIPGMVIAAKGLIDQNPDPSLEDVRVAIRYNICRCTGYKMIEDAILLAAKILREDTPVKETEFKGVFGESMHRIDAGGKAIGISKFSEDIYLPGMLHGSAVRSAYPRARVLSIDTAAAKALPGVAAVLTAADIPGSVKQGYNRPDWDVLVPIGAITHYLGDAVALVAAESKEILEEAKRLVKVEYEELPAIFTPQESRDGVVKVHEEFDNLVAEFHLVRGNVDEAIKNSKHVVTKHYTTPWHEHAFMEPECAVAEPEGEDGLHIFSGDQGIYEPRRRCSEVLGIPPENIHVTGMLIGGAFGAKNDMSVQHHAALLAWVIKRPVKVCLTRQESLQIHAKRAPMEIEFTSACDENGILTAIKADIIRDNGAYTTAGIPVLQRAVVHGPGPYMCQNIDIVGRGYYTNNPPGGAFRGFGVPITAFCGENNLNLLAEMAGISPFEIRYRNAARPGGVLCNGQIIGDDCALVECLESLRADFDANPKAGIACAFKNSGVGVGLPDIGRCRLVVREGMVHIYSSAACLGQGMGTVEIQMLCQTTGVEAGKCVYHTPDTLHSPDSGMSIASRHTLFTGEAVCIAARELKTAMDAVNGNLNELEGQEFYGEYSGITDPIGSPKENPVSHISYSYSALMAILDNEGKVKKFISANDVGHAVNPKAIQGQIQGGVAMSMGFALTEELKIERGLVTTRYGTLGLLRAGQVPDIEVRIIEKKAGNLAHGAKGCGEISTIPIAPALSLAYYNQTGTFQTKIPLDTPYSRKRVTDSSSDCITFDSSKCLLCGKCVLTCAEVQTVGALDIEFEDISTRLAAKGAVQLSDTDCVGCGQCRASCPSGALDIKSDIGHVRKAIEDENTIVVAQIAPSLRVGIGGHLGFPGDRNAMPLLIDALHKLGFDKVFDTSLGADLTVLEELDELLERLKHKKDLPLLTSCCPAWVKFCENRYPELAANISTCRSPQQMMGALIKAYYEDPENKAGKRVVSVSIMPCTAKKAEILRSDSMTSGNRDVDYSLTTTELLIMLSEANLTAGNCLPCDADEPFAYGSGGGTIFGVSGGVTEAVLRCLSPDNGFDKPDLTATDSVRGYDGIKQATVMYKGNLVKIAVVSGLGNADRLMQKILSGENEFSFIEVMACPGGCIMGGGQPYDAYKLSPDQEQRSSGLYDTDENSAIKAATENPLLKEIRQTLLKGRTRELLHRKE